MWPQAAPPPVPVLAHATEMGFGLSRTPPLGLLHQRVVGVYGGGGAEEGEKESGDHRGLD
jgi:hypothetical protein